MKEFIKKHKMGLFVTVSALVMLLGLSYAWLQLTLNGTKDLTLTAGSLVVELDDTMSGGINMSGTYPLTMEEGKATDAYTFTLTNKGTIDSDYTIYLDDVALATGETRMADSNIRYYLTKDGSDKSNALLSTTGTNPNRILDTGKIAPNKMHTYSLRLWIDYDTGNEAMNKSLKTKIRVEAMQGKPAVPAVETLLEKTNPVAVTDYNTGNKAEMFTFTHPAGEQQAGYTEEELTDYRYIGNTPNNYVTFNNETWRIIGVFTLENESGVKEKRIKIIRDEPIGNYLWDTSEETINYGNGINEWSQADLMKLMNPGHTGVGGSLYYNGENGTCYSGQNNEPSECDFTTTGLSEEAKSMIGDTKWWLGGNSIGFRQSGPKSYAFERGNTVLQNPTDGITRMTSWVGKIGLMYPSDYAYTYANGVDNKCYTELDNCYTADEYGGGGTPTAGWLFNSKDQWLLSPTSSHDKFVFSVRQSGIVYHMYNYDSRAGVRPSLYLTSDTKISSGNGSNTSPYTLNK